MAASSPGSTVRASRHSQSAWVPLVIHILRPVITQSSPSRTALVRMPATSLPASGSLTATEVTISPRRAGARYLSFSSSVPYLASDGVDIVACTAMASGTPAASDLPSSSPRIML